MRLIYQAIIAALYIMVLAACKKDFLDVRNSQQLFRQDYVKNLETTEEYLNGIYINITSEFFTGYNMIYPELAADNISPVVGTQQMNLHYKWGQLANDDRISVQGNVALNMNHLWREGFKIVRDCAFVLESAEKYKNENIRRANNIRGQALTIRALVNFVLVNTFSQSYGFTADATHPGIPYVTSYDWSKEISRQTVKDVYEGMTRDLYTSLNVLPLEGGDKRHMNINAAKALLARVLLFKGDFAQARIYATDVLTNVPLLSKAEYPEGLFTQNEKEALFQLAPSWTGVSGGGGEYEARFEGLYFADPLLEFMASRDIAELFEKTPQDVRRSWITRSGSNYFISKFPNNLIEGFPVGTQSYFQTLLRSSEACLIAAESYAMIKNEDSARFFLNQIRNRADLPSVKATGLALLDSIYLERRKELAFEGLRMFDIQRLKQDVVRQYETNNVLARLPYPNEKAISPIPKSDVLSLKISQNAGY